MTCTVAPAGQTICDGGSATFTCTYFDGFPDYIYSWAGPNNFSTNTAAFTINPAHTADAGEYTCTVTDTNGCTFQDSGTLIVTTVTWGAWTLATAPTVTVTAVSITNCIGLPVSISSSTTTNYGTKKQSDLNGCQPDQTNTLALSAPTTIWTVSGCSPVPSSGNGATAAFTPGSAGNGTVTFTASATTDDPSGTYTGGTNVPFTIVEVASLTADQGSAPDGPTNIVDWASTGNVTVTCTLNPDITTGLPNCYSLTNNGASLGQALSTTIDKSMPGITTVIATAGTSSKTNVIVVVRCEFMAFARSAGGSSFSGTKRTGHAWWKLTVVPSEAVFLVGDEMHQALVNTGIGYYRRTPTGFGVGLGAVDPSESSPDGTVFYWWNITWSHLLSGIDFSRTLQLSPGTYSWTTNSCVTEARKAATATGCQYCSSCWYPWQVVGWINNLPHPVSIPNP